MYSFIRIFYHISYKKTLQKKSSNIFCSQFREEKWYECLGGNDNPLADVIMNRIVSRSGAKLCLGIFGGIIIFGIFLAIMGAKTDPSGYNVLKRDSSGRIIGFETNGMMGVYHISYAAFL